MTDFREQQIEYEARLLEFIFENPPEPSTIKAVADSHYIVPSILQRRLLEQTEPLEEAYIYRQRITAAKKVALTT
jgi:AraC-like DNA-binding protein